jgi:hypothetical protein
MSEEDRPIGPGDVVDIRGEARQIVSIAPAPGGVFVVTRKPPEVAD